MPPENLRDDVDVVDESIYDKRYALFCALGLGTAFVLASLFQNNQILNGFLMGVSLLAFVLIVLHYMFLGFRAFVYFLHE